MSIVTFSSENKTIPYFSAFLVTLVTILGLAGCGGGGSSTPELSVNNPSVLEGDTGTTEVVFTVSLNKDASSILTVDVATADVTATGTGPQADYTPVSETLTIAKGSRSASVSVYVNGDTELESHETFTLGVSNPQGFKVKSSTLSATATITNDEAVDPKGYFNGTATLNGTDYNDMTAMIYDNRVLMFSPTANVLYDIDLNTPDSLDYEGTVDLYVNGQVEQIGVVTVSGEVHDTELTGSISGGTGFGAGSFDVAFDSGNNVGATLGRIETTGSEKWSGDLNSVDTVIGSFRFNSLGVWGGGNNNIPACEFTNGVTGIPSADTNIFQLSNVVNQSVNCNYVGSGFNGFGSVIDVSGTDDGLIFAESNGTYAVFSIMTFIP